LFKPLNLNNRLSSCRFAPASDVAWSTSHTSGPGVTYFGKKDTKWQAFEIAKSHAHRIRVSVPEDVFQTWSFGMIPYYCSLAWTLDDAPLSFFRLSVAWEQFPKGGSSLHRRQEEKRVCLVRGTRRMRRNGQTNELRARFSGCRQQLPRFR
jgi:hypothetical protein